MCIRVHSWLQRFSDSTDLQKRARESRQSRERFRPKLHFCESLCLASFVCFVGSSLFVRIRACRLPAAKTFGLGSSEGGAIHDSPARSRCANAPRTSATT